MPRTVKPTLSPEAVRVRLRELIAASGRSAASVAESAGMSPPQLWQILSGHRAADPQIGSVIRVLNALGKRWRDLD